jgi:hypothetical protein
MTQEELLVLEGKKTLLRTMMSSMSLHLKTLRVEIKETEDQWELFNKEFIKLDREVAFATKVRVLGRKRTETPMTAEKAQEMLALLGYSDLTITDEEEKEIEDGSDSDL